MTTEDYDLNTQTVGDDACIILADSAEEDAVPPTMNSSFPYSNRYSPMFVVVDVRLGLETTDS